MRKRTRYSLLLVVALIVALAVALLLRKSAPPEATRPLRIAQISYDMIAASNMPTAEQIHSILDRRRTAASPFSGSSLLSARYRDVPLLSSAWGIGHIGLPFSDRGYIAVFGLQLPLS